MSGLTKWVDNAIDIEKRVARLESTTQLSSSTVGGDTAIAVQAVVEEAAVTNDALPGLQDDAADGNDGVTDLQDTLTAADDDLDARLEDERAQLEDARADLELSQQDIEDAFGQTVEGLSDDVDTAIRAAGDAKTEAEAASDAALAASGLAASKGKTIVQVSAPTGANADPTNLWINISTDGNGVPKNQPNRYNPDTAKWEPITDAQAVAAAQVAATAVVAAQAAKDTADQANAAAGVAKQAAADANTAALQAAGIANGKGKVIYQASKPTGTNAAAGNLWIRTSDNTPWAYDASIPDWVQVTDQTAKDAAAAAVTAQQAATAAANAASAAQATADGKPLILFSSSAGPSGTAPTGSIWFLWDSAKNVAGQWLQSGTLANPVWTPQQIRSEVIANLDVGKLTAGSAAIADLVAQKIAASTANFQTANVSNLFVTSGATMSQAVIDYLFANVVQAKKITAGMIDVSTLNGITLTGVTVTGGQLVTSKDPNAPDYGTVKIANSSIAWYNDTAGKPHNAFTLLGSDGSLYMQGNIALNASGSSRTSPYVKLFTLPTFLPWVVAGPGSYMSLSCGNAEIGGVLYSHIIQVGGDQYASSPSRTISMDGDKGTVRIATTADLSLGSSGHGFQIGSDTSTNLAMDNNEIMVRNNGGVGSLFIQGDGGSVGFGGDVTISGNLGNAWVSVPKASGYTDASLGLQAKLVAGNIVMLRGQLNKSSGAYTGSENGVATLAAAYRPSQTCFGLATTTAGNFARIRINTDGKIDIYGVTSGTNNYAIFDGILIATD